MSAHTSSMVNTGGGNCYLICVWTYYWTFYACMKAVFGTTTVNKRGEGLVMDIVWTLQLLMDIIWTLDTWQCSGRALLKWGGIVTGATFNCT